MKFLLVTLTILFFFTGCSFDNKSGIWKNNETVSIKIFDVFANFEILSIVSGYLPSSPLIPSVPNNLIRLINYWITD